MKKLTPVSFNSITLKVSNGWATVEGQLENGKTLELIHTYCEDTIVHHDVHPWAQLRQAERDEWEKAWQRAEEIERKNETIRAFRAENAERLKISEQC